MLLDEPMAGVNPALGRQLVEHVLRLRTETGMTFLFVEHDLDIVMEASDRVIVMNEGRVIASGTPAEVRGDQRVVDAYLGTGASAMSEPLLEVADVEAGYGEALVLRGVSLDGVRGRARRDHRPERRRQVDAPEGDLRPPSTDLPAGSATERTTSRECARSD